VEFLRVTKRRIYSNHCALREDQEVCSDDALVHNVSGHYTSCLYIKTSPSLCSKTQRSGDWILSPSSGKTYSVMPNR
jgi:hypothetical protein